MGNAKTQSQLNLSSRFKRFYSFMLANPVGVLSTITPDEEPHGVVIYYVPDEKLNIYFITREGTRKCDNIRHNNIVSLTAFNSMNQSSIQAIGHCMQIGNKTELNNLAGEILNISNTTSLQKLPPLTKLSAGPYIGFKIVPDQIRMAVYSPPENRYQNHELFESIESFDLRA